MTTILKFVNKMYFEKNASSKKIGVDCNLKKIFLATTEKKNRKSNIENIKVLLKCTLYNSLYFLRYKKIQKLINVCLHTHVCMTRH